MERAIIEELKTNVNYEAEAYTSGKVQAMELIKDGLSYELLCELANSAKAFEVSGETGTNYIDRLDNYPAPLRYHLIKGFYDFVTMAVKELVRPCKSGGGCAVWCTRCEDSLADEVTKQADTVVDAEFIKIIQDTARVMVQTAAEISNAIRSIERKCGQADDKVIVAAIQSLNNAAGNVSEQWAELDLTLASYDMLDPR